MKKSLLVIYALKHEKIYVLFMMGVIFVFTSIMSYAYFGGAFLSKTDRETIQESSSYEQPKDKFSSAVQKAVNRKMHP